MDVHVLKISAAFDRPVESVVGGLKVPLRCTDVVSEMLGHSSIAIALDTYPVLPNMQDSAARALEEALR